MAKVKEKNASTTKSKTEPAKANPGKVRKLRVSVKRVKKINEPKIRNTSEKTTEVSPKLKLCMVKLRRTRLNNSYVKESSNNNDNTNKKDNNNTLRVQCKNVGGREASKESTKKSATRIRKSKTSKSSDSVLEKNISNEKNLSKASRNRRDKIKPSTPLVSANEIEGNKEPTTTVYTKRCAVRLQRTPIANEVQKSNKKNCKVRLRKISFHQKMDQAIERTESRDCSSESNHTNCTLPVIDNDKRDNFLKLSLTRSSTKQTNKMNKQQKLIDNANPSSTNEIIEENTEEQNDVVLTQLKHVPSLSLRKTIGQNMTNVSTTTDLTQFDHPQDMTTYFEPLRNSTVLICNRTNESTNDKNSASKTVNAKPDNTRNCRTSAQNLANKSDEIENLLNSLDGDDGDGDDDHEEANENNKNNETVQVKAAHSKTNKFFHYKKDNLHEDISMKPLFKAPIKPQNLKKVKKRKPSTKKRSSLKNSNDIYEFLSQSQTSDCDGGKRTDPTADIIKKLMDQGKVRVATISKGKGRPMFKRKIPHKQMKTIKQTAANKPKQLKNKIKTVTISENVIEHEAAEDDHFQDHFDDHFDDHFGDHDLDNDDINSERVNHKNRSKQLTNNSKNDQEGTFSRLAKSVLINQTGRSDLQRKKNASNLLEMVKKYISTPKNKQPMPDTTLHPDLSPIPMPFARPATKASPWRVDEDAHLPRLFNFSRSSANLPSYSSDYIPSTPRKEKSNHKYVQLLQEEDIDSSDNFSVADVPPQSSLHEQTHIERAENEPSVISSFSSNDSNAENIAPHHIEREGRNENNNIFDLKQFPNPRRALSYRSPLKTINILEVVHLPPFKPTSPKKVNDVIASNKETVDHDSLQAVQNVVDVRKSPQKSYLKDNNNTIEQGLFGFEENICHDSLQDVHNVTDIRESPQKTCTEESNKSIVQDFSDLEENFDPDSLQVVQNEADVGKSPQKKSILNNNNLTKEDLFGFEEFLSQTNASSQEYSSTNDDNNANTRPNVTIHDKLQDLRKLKPEDNELLKEKLNYCVQNRHLFENEATILGGDGKRQRNIKEMLCSTMIHHQQPSTSKEALKDLRKRNELRDDCDLSELFKDPEPETTFNENEAHRTYVRPYKRKRRLNEKNLVVFFESDNDSGDEENVNGKQKHNHSNESTDTSSENVQKKKRKRKAPKVNHELEDFVEEFNEMCKEVDSFELMVEKST